MNTDICIIDPFYGGSHKQLIDLIKYELNISNMKYDFYSLPAKKWPWRARCSALYFSQIIKKNHSYKFLFSSSILNLAELISLRKDLSNVKKIIYFHENQLLYPVRNKDNKERDFQFGYNQILTSLVADKLVFNSNFNKTSFLNSINSHLKLIPDNRPKIDTKCELEPKCDVLYFPIDFKLEHINSIVIRNCMDDYLDYFDMNNYSKRPIHICWPHRWEHDKNPEEFFNALFKLNEMNIDFRVSVLGEMYTEVPEIFNIAKEKLKSKIINWGYLQSKDDYYNVLSKCDVVVSTSLHEFFGVAVIEACLFGCYPILPNRLVYPELYIKECLYSTEAQLVKKLKQICIKPEIFRKIKTQLIFNTENICFKYNTKYNFINNFLWSFMKKYYIELFK